METDIFDQGLTLMLAGVGAVFVFLTALVIAMTLMSKIILTFQRQITSSEASDEEVAAISAAITKHRNQ